MEFGCQYQSAKSKIHKIVSYFWQINVGKLVAYMVAVCGSYFRQVGIYLLRDHLKTVCHHKQFD